MLNLLSPWHAVNFQLPVRPYPPPQPLALELPPGREPPQGRGVIWVYESVIAGARDAAAFPGRATRILVVFSDGLGDTSSEAADAAAVCQELGIPAYPVVLHPDDAGPSSTAYKIREADFVSLGESTGGRAFAPTGITAPMVGNILRSIAGEVRTVYVAGFAPEAPMGKPRKHTVEVRLRDRRVGKLTGGARTLVH